MNEKNKMKKYADKYFLRTNEILKAENLNPWINMQVFVRKGPGKVAGIKEAIDIITQNSNIEKVGGRIYAAKEGSTYNSKETLMNILVPIQEKIELETVYLGVITAGITRENDHRELNYSLIGENMAKVVELAGHRPVLYFGARHWHYSEDKALSKLAFENGIRFFSTDNGAECFGLKGGGTIPHALENIYAWKSGFENAVKESTLAFDRVIDPEITRIALIDYNNREITDTLSTAKALGSRLYAVRVDTCGENIMENAIDGTKKYWEGKGVTVDGVAKLRRAMNEHSYSEHVKIVLSSGFGNPEKVQAFNDGEKYYNLKLYDMIGAGFIDDVRTATADIVAIGNNVDEIDFYAGKFSKENLFYKVGRPPMPNYNLERIL
jgi:nicotinate phosphoribosyltransferase